MVARRPCARARGDARLHGRVRARDRRRRAHREPHGPRRPRRQPAARGRPVAGRRVRRRRPASLRRRRGSVSRPRRLLVLAEGQSADPHYGKTARGVMRYRPDDVVALLDSRATRASRDGFPVVGTVAEARALEPTTALVGVATPAAGSRRRGGAARRLHRSRARPRERPARVHLRRSRARRARRASTESSCATCAGRRPGSTSRPART